MKTDEFEEGNEVTI